MDTSRYRDFDVAREEIEGPPMRFKLGGQEFTCRAMIPAGPLLTLARNHHLTGLEAMAELGAFLYAIVRPEEEATLREVMDDVSFPMAVAVVAWVVEEATGRPLPKLSDSDSKPSENGADTKAVSLSAVATPTE